MYVIIIYKYINVCIVCVTSCVFMNLSWTSISRLSLDTGKRKKKCSGIRQHIKLCTAESSELWLENPGNLTIREEEMSSLSNVRGVKEFRRYGSTWTCLDSTCRRKTASGSQLCTSAPLSPTHFTLPVWKKSSLENTLAPWCAWGIQTLCFGSVRLCNRNVWSMCLAWFPT